MFPPITPNPPPQAQPPIPQQGQPTQAQGSQGAPPPYEEDPTQTAARPQYPMMYYPYPYAGQVFGSPSDLAHSAF